jgi:dolichyl-phosphate beta-glucosyltransferase
MEKTVSAEIGLVIPCFNEENRLDMAAFGHFLDTFPQFFLCFVDDGSTDRTAGLLKSFCSGRERCRVLHLEQNRGKAEAVRHGMLWLNRHGDIPFLGYFDADLSAPLDFALELRETLLQRPGTWMVFGSRQLADKQHITRRRRRHLAGRFVSALINYAVKARFTDTQCGAKLFPAEAVHPLFQEPFLSSWIFDVELIQRICNQFGHNEGMARIAEIPVSRWRDVGDSKVSPGYIFKLFGELRRIRRTAS